MKIQNLKQRRYRAAGLVNSIATTLEQLSQESLIYARTAPATAQSCPEVVKRLKQCKVNDCKARQQ